MKKWNAPEIATLNLNMTESGRVDDVKETHGAFGVDDAVNWLWRHNDNLAPVVDDTPGEQPGVDPGKDPGETPSTDLAS